MNKIFTLCSLVCLAVVSFAGGSTYPENKKLKAFYAPVYADRPWHVGLVYNSLFFGRSGKPFEMNANVIEQFKPMYSDQFGLRLCRAPIDWGLGIQTGVYYNRQNYYSTLEGTFGTLTSYGKMYNTYHVNYLHIPMNILIGPNEGDLYFYFKLGASLDYFMDVTSEGVYWNPITQTEFDVHTKTTEQFEQMRWNFNSGMGLSAHFGMDSQFGFLLELNLIKALTDDAQVFYSQYRPLFVGVTTGLQYNFRARRSRGGESYDVTY